MELKEVNELIKLICSISHATPNIEYNKTNTPFDIELNYPLPYREEVLYKFIKRLCDEYFMIHYFSNVML